MFAFTLVASVAVDALLVFWAGREIASAVALIFVLAESRVCVVEVARSALAAVRAWSVDAVRRHVVTHHRVGAFIHVHALFRQAKGRHVSWFTLTAVSPIVVHAHLRDWVAVVGHACQALIDIVAPHVVTSLVTCFAFADVAPYRVHARLG